MYALRGSVEVVFEVFNNHCSIGGLPWWLSGRESVCSAAAAGDLGSIPGLGRSLGGEHANPLQYSCLESLMDRGAWRVTVHGVAKGQTQLSNLAQHSAHETYHILYAVISAAQHT